MASSSKGENLKKTTGWFAFRWIAGMFLVMFVANGIFLSYALQTNSGLQDENAYEKGRNYNDQLALNRLKAELGWTMQLSYDEGVFGLVILNVDGEIVKPETLTARLFRPTNAREDIAVNVAINPDGSFTLTSERDFSGLWDLKLAVAWEGRTLEFNERIVTR